MQFVRKYFPIFAGLLLLSALVWAMSFGTLPRADFSFGNGDEPKTIDPAKATGAPEGRILNGLFEGLLRSLPVEGAEPDDNGVVPMSPQPGMAESYEVSKDGKVYTFHIRKDAKWTNGDEVTADDFRFSWQRMLLPETRSEYSYQLYYVKGALAYNTSQVEVGDQVEVELRDRKDPTQPYPRGTIERGVLKEIIQPPPPKKDDVISRVLPLEMGLAGLTFAIGKPYTDIETKEGQQPTFVVDINPEVDGKLDLSAKGELKRFKARKQADIKDKDVLACNSVLPDFGNTGGIKVIDKHTLEVTLNDRTPFFPDLVAFYPLYPVNKNCVEEHGSPDWTKADNIVSNGPFTLKFRRIRDRLRMVKNEDYWNADTVSLNTVDVMAVKSENTSLNMYLDGSIDWSTQAPAAVIPTLKKRKDWVSAPMLSTYFYRVNVNEPPLNDKRVRQALNLAIDKALICEKVTQAGQVPARSFVPPGLPNYPSDKCVDSNGDPVVYQCGEYNPEKAKQLLADAGYPGGAGFPKVEILYNTSEGHRAIAEVVQQQWKNTLGVDIGLKNVEWASFLETTREKKYQIARAGWIGDYPDPNTFLDMFVTDGGNNQTNWSNKQYDQLIADAQSEPDPIERLCKLQRAEAILMDELPILPFYFYVSVNLVNPRVKGFSGNIQDLHPLTKIRIEE